MAIVINGSGTVTGISVGGLPDGIVDAGTLATNSVDSAELIDGAVDDSHMASISGRKNILINGAMNVAQRGTSSTSTGNQTVDRFYLSTSGVDEAVTQAQHALTSSDTGPWAKGFRTSYHLTNGNQTSGAGAADRVIFQYLVEAQDIANSGWDYTSASSYVTLSFWIKSSVAQNFYGKINSTATTAQAYAFETGSLTADTWTKIEKTISGNSNIVMPNNNTHGLTVEIVAFRGTDTTGSMSLDTWAANDNAVRVPDMTSTWYTTNDATFEITGVQLEVGSVATNFEHRSYGEELYLCQRYYESTPALDEVTSARQQICFGSGAIQGLHFDVRKRAAPTVVLYGRTGVAGSVSNINTGGVTTGCTASSVTTDGCHYITGSGFTAGISYEVNYSADAEL